MSRSRSPTWMHRAGSPNSAIDWRIFSSQRKLSFSMGIRIGSIFFLSAAVPLNFVRVQIYGEDGAKCKWSMDPQKHTRFCHANRSGGF
ncbi:hypothetical protein IQ26_06853 [Mesorhizobium tianshanense]|uniref:Uncharacterized protein n=1 Tax=Mesorhizobium tianshanense TaxID=39844 RepID=A0A562MNP1_9HYPH|nr:hypothetical protein IQ26_06853 [Mesorhizobium tianshanense]